MERDYAQIVTTTQEMAYLKFDAEGKAIPKISSEEKFKKLSKAKAEKLAEGRKCNRCHVLVKVVFDEDYAKYCVECPNCKRIMPVFVRADGY